jgi:hypothetical protein
VRKESKKVNISEKKVKINPMKKISDYKEVKQGGI